MSAEAYVERAWLHYRTKQYDLALADAKRSLEINSTIQGGHAHRGVALFELGEPENAIADLTEATRLYPDDDFPLTHRGWVYENIGEIEKARADYEAALKRNPHDAWLKKALQLIRQ